MVSVKDLLPLVVQHFVDQGKTDDEIDAILAKEQKNMTQKYNDEIKRDFHVADAMAAYTSYKADVQPMIAQLNKLRQLSAAKQANVQRAKNAGGSNSNQEIAASSQGSNARSEIDRITGEMKERIERYQAELAQAHQTAANELIKFVELVPLHEGGRRTRKRKTRARRQRKTRARR
jgi:hypothetical protein